MTKPEELPITPSPMDNTYTPLLSDGRIHDRVDEYTLPYRTEITRVVKEFRDIYERDRRQTHAELAELRAENERMREAGERCANSAMVLHDHYKSAGDMLNADVCKRISGEWDAATRKPSQPSTKDTE